MGIREVIPLKKAESAQEKATAQIWELLTDAEKETRIEAFKEEEEKLQVSITESVEKDAELYFAKELPDRLQHVLDVKQKERNEAIRLSADKQKLTNSEKETILTCIRYSFLPQEELLKLSTDDAFTLAKEFIVQGLAIKLGGA